MSSDLLWAFQPKTHDRASPPLRLKAPPMPSFDRAASVASKLARNAASGVFSTSPNPNRGVGMRNTTLFSAICRAKSGCFNTHPFASLRPAIVYKPCTSPSSAPSADRSADPSALRTNLATRTGPLAVMNEGTELVAPSSVAKATADSHAAPRVGRPRAASSRRRLRMTHRATVPVKRRSSPLPFSIVPETEPASRTEEKHG